MKNVALAAITPALLVPLAEEIMGKTISPLRERWAPGSLLGNAISKLEEPAFVLFSPKGALVFTPQPTAVGGELPTAIESGFDTYTVAFAATVAEGSSTRSRILNFDAPVVITEGSVAGVAGVPAALVSALAFEPRLALSAAQVINRIFDVFDDPEDEIGLETSWFGFLDQVTGRVSVGIFDGLLEDTLLSLPAAAMHTNILSGGPQPWDLVAAYDFSIAETVAPPSIDAPVWG